MFLVMAIKKNMKNDLGVKVLLPEYNLARILVDKSEVSEALEPYGLVPKSFTLTIKFI